MTAQTQTVLVTGGSGFLGSWCLIELLRRGHNVRTTVRDLSREPEVRAAVAPQTDAGDRLSVLAADLRSDDGWDKPLRDATTSCTLRPRSHRCSRRIPTS